MSKKNLFFFKNSHECLQTIVKLENQIISDLTNFNKTDLEQDDEKEQKKILEFYQKLDVTSQEATEKMQQISTKLENIIPDLKVLLYPDETKWKTWNAIDFYKFVSRFLLKILLQEHFYTKRR